jgi:hypothetical protein
MQILVFAMIIEKTFLTLLFGEKPTHFSRNYEHENIRFLATWNDNRLTIFQSKKLADFTYK